MDKIHNIFRLFAQSAGPKGLFIKRKGEIKCILKMKYRKVMECHQKPY